MVIMVSRNRLIKNALGDLPLAAELYWRLIQNGKPVTKNFSLRRLKAHLPEWCEAARQSVQANPASPESGKRVLIFTTLRYWIEHGALLSASLAGLGHQVTLAYLPIPNFKRPLSKFDLRRHNAYAQSVLKLAAGVFTPISLFSIHGIHTDSLPPALDEAIKEVSLRDAQYGLQIEDIETEVRKSPSGRLYRLRLHRNRFAAAAILAWYQSLPSGERPEILLTPNGSIMEMGAVYRTMRFLGVPAVTYEYGEQRGRVWLAQNQEVMQQDTQLLWESSKSTPLTEDQWETIRSLYQSRQNGKLWENFGRLWQGSSSQGGALARQELGLDSRPIVLLAANVIGDSLTLGRQLFSRNMTEWLEKTIQHFSQRPDVQLVVRIHPGERYIKGPSVAEVASRVLQDSPTHIRLVEAQNPINTYDLIDIADLGLAYTTTVGMEMAMSGVPVILGGSTHYRSKGFTLDPTSWEDYFATIDRVIADPNSFILKREQVDQAWNYAYRFFFEYPQPFPWHLLEFWDELATWPVGRVLSAEGQAQFGHTFDALLGYSEA